jgi:hypothetical protein
MNTVMKKPSQKAETKRARNAQHLNQKEKSTRPKPNEKSTFCS